MSDVCQNIGGGYSRHLGGPEAMLSCVEGLERKRPSLECAADGTVVVAGQTGSSRGRYRVGDSMTRLMQPKRVGLRRWYVSVSFGIASLMHAEPGIAPLTASFHSHPSRALPKQTTRGQVVSCGCGRRQAAGTYRQWSRRAADQGRGYLWVLSNGRWQGLAG